MSAAAMRECRAIALLCVHGDARGVEAMLLQGGPDWGSPEWLAARDAFNPAHAAALADSPACLALLAESGLPIDEPGGGAAKGLTPLVCAAEAGMGASAAWLLGAGADPERAGRKGSARDCARGGARTVLEAAIAGAGVETGSERRWA